MAYPSGVRFKFDVHGHAFDVVRFELREGVSRSFRLELDLSRAGADLEPVALLDREAVFTIERNGVVERTVPGIVTAFGQDETGPGHTRYRAVVESPLARLGLRLDSRIFQQVDVTHVLAMLLEQSGIHATRAAYFAAHGPREYCVQYRETDAAFFRRLAAGEGIVFWHEVDSGRAVLVLSDKIGSAPVLPEGAPVRYDLASDGGASARGLWRFASCRKLAPTHLTLRECAFHQPRYHLQHEAKAWAVEEAVGAYGHYVHVGRYQPDAAGSSFARNTLSGLRNAADTAAIAGDDARLFPGLSFDLAGHPTGSFNDHWRVITMHHIGEQPGQNGEGHAARYRYEATVVPAHYDWKPESAERPIVDGPQIACVVGPGDEETHCDEHGRVQVRFPWDRRTPQESASCWLRVWQGWAGAMQPLPRVGEEVMVSFLDGDPDQPIITSRACDARHRLQDPH